MRHKIWHKGAKETIKDSFLVGDKVLVPACMALSISKYSPEHDWKYLPTKKFLRWSKTGMVTGGKICKGTILNIYDIYANQKSYNPEETSVMTVRDYLDVEILSNPSNHYKCYSMFLSDAMNSISGYIFDNNVSENLDNKFNKLLIEKQMAYDRIKNKEPKQLCFIEFEDGFSNYVLSDHIELDIISKER